MSKKPKIVNLNDLFGLDDEWEEENQEIKKDIPKINISNLVPFQNHPFKLYEGDRLEDMVGNIKEQGIIIPLIVRPKDDGKYEILSGHNRANAGKLAGLEKVPVIIKENLTDEEAMLIVTETNLIQRSFSELTHSEKARILAERHNAIKNQGKRIDLINEIEIMSNTHDTNENLNFRQIGESHRSDEKIGNKYDLSPRNVSRYIRVDILIDELKTRLDKNEIPFIAGVDLSHLKIEEQEIIEELLIENNFKIDLKKAEILKTFAQGRNFTKEKALAVLSGEYFNKPKKAKKPKFTSKFTKNIIKKWAGEERTVRELEEIIEELLEQYFGNE